ncbi:MAG: polysaccharide biosynthesis/export family protein [Lautropia sp.]
MIVTTRSGRSRLLGFLRRLLPVLALALGACASLPKSLPTSGPSVEVIEQAAAAAREHGIVLVPITETVSQAVRQQRARTGFADTLAAADAGADAPAQRVGVGDTIEVSVWEAPPAMLFGVTNSDPRLLAGTAVVTHLPAQIVDADGTINMPFAGRVRAGGSTPREIEGRIAAMLKGKANQLQALVRIAGNASANVTVIGEVRNSSRVGLTPTNERLLDVLAAAGGVTQPVGKITLQLTRGGKVVEAPLDAVIRDPRQNIAVRPGDVVTALHQPYAFSVLGAAGRNEEIPFEANGLSLTQALARAGGVNDTRADRRGVFVFRFEDPQALARTPGSASPLPTTVDGKVPVVYQLDLEDPASFLVAQRFPIENKDVLYVSNAPAAELQKFLNIVTSIATPILAVRSLTR